MELDLEGMEPLGDRMPLWQRVAARIEAALDVQGLKAGDTLPGEDRIGLALGVSKPIVRLALDSLERKGILEKRPGRRTRVVRGPA